MNQISEPSLIPIYFRALIIVTFVVLAFLGESFAYRRYTGLSHGQSILLSVLATGLAVVVMFLGGEQHRHNYNYEGTILDTSAVYLAWHALLPLLGVPFVVRLYRKWIGGQLTDAEQLPGMDGVRAWLGFGNLICAILIPICAWQVFQVSLPAMFVLTFGLLLAYPIFNLASAAPQPAPAAPTEDLSNEREKVLQLLEAGKITADESAELLNALGSTVPQRQPPASEMDLSPQRKIVLLGAALLLLGFFLPWFNINPGQLLNEAASQMQATMNNMMPGNMMPQVNLAPNTGTVKVSAGNLGHGLGWWILALGIGAAVLPFFATTLKAGMQKKVILAALAVGAFLLIYLLSDTLRYVSIGVILALGGYALEIIGTLKERPAAR
jgi:hypothetical protein